MAQEINHGISFVPSFEHELKYTYPVAGIDEAGVGPWAGPVVAAAVILSPDTPQVILQVLNDSKKLKESVREKIYDLLFLHYDHVYIGVGEASVQEIDTLNIRQATFLAMGRALENLPLRPTAVLIDGNAKPPLNYPVEMIIKGDQKSLSIAAASIIAKVTRDRMMKKLALEHPHYGWDKNAGYGTALHQTALKSHGVTKWHRQSYRPIAELLDVAPSS